MPLNLERLKTLCRRNLLTLLIFTGAFLGFVLGFILRYVGQQREEWWTVRERKYFLLIGEIYLSMLNMFILPLLMCAVVTGVASLNLQASWRVAASFGFWSLLTEYLAVVTGIILAVIIAPGVDSSVKPQETGDVAYGLLGVDTALDVFRNMFPENIVMATLSQERTKLVPNESLAVEEWEINVGKVDGTNIPGLITFSIVLGLAIAASQNSGQSLLDLLETLSKCMMLAIGWVIWSTPVAVFFIVTAKLLEERDLIALFEKLGLYNVTVLVGLSIHVFITLPTLYFLLVRRSPFKLLGSMAQAFATAFGTASSNATLPITMNCLEQRVGLDGRIVKFVTPVCTVFNQDGTGLYEAVAVIFITQIHGISLDMANLFLISVTVTAACLAGPGVPQAGLVTMALILTSLGLPASDVGIIVAFDWLLDRFRTTVNVASDSLAVGVIEHFSKSQLADIGKRKYVEVPQEEIEEIELSNRSEEQTRPIRNM